MAFSYFAQPEPEPIARDEAGDSRIEGSIVESELLDSSTSLQISGPNLYWLSLSGQPHDVLSPRNEPRRWFTHKEKRKKKKSEYNIGKDESDQSKSDSRKHEDGPPEMRSESAKRAIKSAEQKL